LPCIYIAYRLGVSEEGIRAALLTLKSSKMRFEINTSEHGPILINDAYNASPTSVKASVHTFLSLYPNRKKMVVLGDIFELGEQSEAFHREVGLFLADKEVDVITIGKAAAWISQMAKGTHYADKHEAAEALKAYLTNEYALLFKASRGMRLEELIKRLA
jgi:UDP-N-acetylmuramoyl-tripeptide--D-alanyl-D-alanine ligase